MYDVLATGWPGRFNGSRPAEDVSLGDRGLGFDSIEIVEFLLDCEERVGTGPSADALLEAGPISIGRVIDHFTRA